MAQQFDNVPKIQLQHKEQVSCKQEDNFIDLKTTLTD